MVRRPSVPSNPHAREFLTTCKPPSASLLSTTSFSRPRWPKAEASHVEAWGNEAAELPHLGWCLPVFGPVQPMWLAVVGGCSRGASRIGTPACKLGGSGWVFSSGLVLCNVTLLISISKALYGVLPPGLNGDSTCLSLRRA